MNKYDLILIHAPSVFDFRNRNDILFAFLSNGGALSISQIYEMYPLGFRTLETSLKNKEKKVAIINLANMMLKDPGLDVEAFLQTLDARMFGIDLHWLAHTQGSLAVASLLKKIHPNIPVIFGGISSTIFHEELISYQQVDFVIRGVETADLIDKLINSLGDSSFDDIPNLCWKDKSGKVVINEPQSTSIYNANVDWGCSEYNINYFITYSGAGCEYNCTFCGGSNYSMKKYHGVENGFACKDPDVFLKELQTIKNHTAKNKRVVTLHHWFENLDMFKKVLDAMSGGSIATIHYTLFNLLSLDHLKLMSQYKIRHLFEISLESHSRDVRRACGKAPFSNEEMEDWLDSLFKYNKKAIVEIYYMIGLPKQTPEIVMGEVEYAEHLLNKYSDYELNVFMCPMTPFLDPSSLIHDNPGKFGYKIFFNNLKDYEKALLVPHWKNSLNYETLWLSRKQIVDVTYQASRKLIQVKQKTSKLPEVLSRPILEKIDSTMSLLNIIEKYENSNLPGHVREKILAYNNEILKSTSSQQSPFNFSVYKNWYE